MSTVIQCLGESASVGDSYRSQTIVYHRHLVMEYFHRFEPQLVAERKSRRLKRRRFWAAGVNDLLAVDQHDKWQRFGLRLHTGIDPFIGRIQWLKVWYTNRNPRLISSYYLDFLEEFKHMPLVTQSDPGSENYGIANVTTALRHWHDPNLQGTLQHRWMRQKKNVMPEITWSQLRRRFTPGFEDILEIGVVNEWYDIGNPLDALLFRWIFIPWMQKELDAYRERVNNSKKRADRNKILPHGVPNDIFERPEHYGCLDFKISIEVEALDYLASQVYTGLGEPEIGRHNVWDIYLDMQDGLTRIANEDGYVDTFWEQIMQESDVTADFEEELLEGQTELLGGMDHPRTDGSYYMGGVNGGLGLDIENNCTLDELDMEGLDKESESEDDEEEIAEALVVEFSDDE
ncbi:hypothetical protein H0H93_012194 [Arthromyces matolae]|nr:hypothetical protein H0H93_012194 [Arthromyces matolae]